MSKRNGKRYAQTAAKVLKGQKGKRYGKSMNKGLLKNHAAKVAKVARNKSAPRLNVACARKIMYARKYTTYIQTIMYAQYTYI